MTTILYNGINPFSGVCPTPLLSRTAVMLPYGARWGQRHDLTLRGQITGRCLSYQEFLARQQAILSGFNKDYQSLQVYDDASFVTGYDFIKVAGINFDASTYANGLIPFEITLESYPEDYFSGTYGILDPREEISFEEQENGSFRITHAISAKGFCTSSVDPSDALDNARVWAQARTGWSSQILPAFVSGIGYGVCLQTVAENYDRLNGAYQITENYLGDSFGAVSDGLLRYTTDYSSGIEDGISTMDVRGEIKGCRFEQLSTLRSKYTSFNAFNEAVNQFRRITNRSDLNSTPVVKGVAEDSGNRAISFNYSYNDDPRPPISVVYSVNFDYDFENDVVQASISATVSSRAVYTSSRWDDVLAVADAIDLYSLIVPSYNTYVNQVAPHLVSFPLNQNKLSYSRQNNEFAASVSLSATFSNAVAPPNGLDSFDGKISVNPALHRYAASPLLDGQGEYYIFDLGFVTRGIIQISAQGIGSDSVSAAQTLAILKTQVQNLNVDYFGGSRMVLENQNYTTGNASFGKQSSVSATFSAESTEFTL